MTEEVTECYSWGLYTPQPKAYFRGYLDFLLGPCNSNLEPTVIWRLSAEFPALCSTKGFCKPLQDVTPSHALRFCLMTLNPKPKTVNCRPGNLVCSHTDRASCPGVNPCPNPKPPGNSQWFRNYATSKITRLHLSPRALLQRMHAKASILVTSSTYYDIINDNKI